MATTRDHWGTKSTRNRSLLVVLLLFPVLLAVLSTYRAEAANEQWKAIPAKDGSPAVIYDPNSVTYHSQYVRRVWTLVVEASGTRKKILEEVNCSHKIIREIQTVTEKSNQSQRLDNTPSDWRGVKRDTATGELFKILCR